MYRYAAITAVLFGLGAFSLPSQAQTAPPDQYTFMVPISNANPAVFPGTDIVPPGALQIESGTSAAASGHGLQLDGPELLARVGLPHNWEIQSQLPNLHFSGMSFGDSTVGVKASFSNPDRPVILIANLSLANGSPEQTSGGYDPGVIIGTCRNLKRALQVSTALDLASVSSPGQSRDQRAQFAGELSWSGSGDTSIYLEAAPFWGSLAESSGITIDTGMSLRAGKNFPFNWRVAVTRQSSETTAVLSVGYLMRYPRALSFLRKDPLLGLTPLQALSHPKRMTALNPSALK